MHSSPKKRPTVFIGSSAENLDIAKTIQRGLDRGFQAKLWPQGIFTPGGHTLQSLVDISRVSDFAVFVVDADDLTHRRGEEKLTTRDNVIFELGLFIGALGPSRCFMVHNWDHKLDLPTDLAGITPVPYGEHDDGNYDAAMGGAISTLEVAMRKQGPARVDSQVTEGPQRQGNDLGSNDSGNELAGEWEFETSFSYIRREPDPGSGSNVGSCTVSIPTTWREVLSASGRSLAQRCDVMGLVSPLGQVADQAIYADGSYYPVDFYRSNGVSISIDLVTEVVVKFQALGLIRAVHDGRRLNEQEWELTELGLREYSRLIGQERHA